MTTAKLTDAELAQLSPAVCEVRLLATIASDRARIAELEKERDEALVLTESCSTLKEMAAACIEGARLTAENERLTRERDESDANATMAMAAAKLCAQDNERLLEILCPRHSVAGYQICSKCGRGGAYTKDGRADHAADCPVGKALAASTEGR